MSMRYNLYKSNKIKSHKEVNKHCFKNKKTGFFTICLFNKKHLGQNPYKKKVIYTINPFEVGSLTHNFGP